MASFIREPEGRRSKQPVVDGAGKGRSTGGVIRVITGDGEGSGRWVRRRGALRLAVQERTRGIDRAPAGKRAAPEQHREQHAAAVTQVQFDDARVSGE